MVMASRSPGYECGEERRAGEELGLRVRRGAGKRQSERVEPKRRGREARVTSEGSGESGRIGRLIYRTPRPPGDPTAHAPPPWIRRLRAVPAPCRPLERAVPGPALRADLSAQARARARPGRTGLGCAFSHRAVPARFARPVWKFILGPSMARRTTDENQSGLVSCPVSSSST